jgi:POLQ-like helicase
MKVKNGIREPGAIRDILYKEFIETLRRAAARYFAAKGAPTDNRHDYCLRSRDLWSKNIICNDVVDYIRGEHPSRKPGGPIPLHRFAHHGLSSQAMIFNLIGPLIVRDDHEPLQTVLAEAGIPWPEGSVRFEFEHEDREVFNEDVGQPTAFDVALFGEKSPVFIEAKLEETRFGGCGAYQKKKCEGRNRAAVDYSRCYLHRQRRRYWELMDHFGIMDEAMEARAECPFVENYQYYRELLFALVKGGAFVLLCDERNPIFAGLPSAGGSSGGLWNELRDTVPHKYHERLAMLTMQQVVRAVKATGRHDDWITEFMRKYALDDGSG